MNIHSSSCEGLRCSSSSVAAGQWFVSCVHILSAARSTTYLQLTNIHWYLMYVCLGGHFLGQSADVLGLFEALVWHWLQTIFVSSGLSPEHIVVTTDQPLLKHTIYSNKIIYYFWTWITYIAIIYLHTHIWDGRKPNKVKRC